MKEYEVIIIGAGHAGCEAAFACARKGHKTLLTSVSLDNIALLACNPSIGGTAKGHLVREIDALGGEMGLAADEACLQLRMLNKGKGAAVQSLRSQTDKYLYHSVMKRRLESTENLDLATMEIVGISVKDNKVCGVINNYGERYIASAVIVACGVYLKSEIITGEYRKSSGPSGFSSADSLSQNLIDLGLNLRRFKTGTPARADGRTLDYEKMERQNGDSDIYSFSFLNPPLNKEQMPCYLTYTTEQTHNLIRANLDRAPMYSGGIKGKGPRYCPCIEDKVVRFADKTRHQVFIEPEGANTAEVYLSGASTSLPVDLQQQMYSTIIGMSNVKLTRYAYAIEYDCIDSLMLDSTLCLKTIKGLYFAGQINGSSGYEEAAAQGLISGINAALYLEQKPPFILSRYDAYIGVLIDDLVTKGTQEPYRMMTSRAEYRIILRQDNADLRLTEKGRAIGLVDDFRWKKFNERKAATDNIMQGLEEKFTAKQTEKLFKDKNQPKFCGSLKLKELLQRPEISMDDLIKYLNVFRGEEKLLLDYAENEIKYQGYLKKEKQLINKMSKLENKSLPLNIDYFSIKGLRIEARQKLDSIRPLSISQASRISGVSPADIAVLMLHLKKYD
ncbi:MAG: tRNA uridine-5-carboxymethylaminomethyl(34) synthesis enzyme MnmG [Clostridia bacterium]|nr:tRNA uridine-5-carboxymethylaminomethyl(34) synthesis enzyme MnmG [Clostridia bacterium]